MAHRAGIVHRDIKPENLMLRSDGFVKILDFGLVKILDEKTDALSITQGIIGTPRYMSPEQARGLEVDARSDVFSTGLVFYELLTGSALFKGSNAYQILASVTSAELPPLERMPEPLTPLIVKALQKDRPSRWPDAETMLKALSDSMQVAVEVRPEKQEASIAVLPFAARGDAAEVAEGILDEIIAGLSRNGTLRVISRSSVMQYVEHCPAASIVGQELNVGLVLEGSIRRSGNKFRVMAQLVNARSGFQIWTDRLEFALKDVFELQDEIAGAIVQALKGHFDVESHKIERVVGTQDTEAGEEYFKGLSLLSSYEHRAMLQAAEHFRKAIEASPSFPHARARLAEVMMYSYSMAPDEEREEILRTAKELVETALRLDPGSSDAHVVTSFIMCYEGEKRRARGPLQKAISLSPNNAAAMAWLGLLEITLGNCEGGITWARKAAERDPMGSLGWTVIGYGLMSQGRLLEAADVLNRGIRADARNPFTFAVTVLNDLFLRNMDDARRMMKHLEMFGEGEHTIITITGLYDVLSGDPLAAERTEKRLAELYPEGDSLRLLADVHAARGDLHKAMGCLEEAVKEQHWNLALMEFDPFLEPVRRLPEFSRLASRLRDLIEEDRALLATDNFAGKPLS
jgi:TolB-like protein/Tfp pilus assembly protein PilF